jgi:acetyl-CoA carboxylase/biotin carboxylase 1
MGIPLHRIADIRSLYGKQRWGEDSINFDNPQPKRPSPRGHVIASRITAENPDEGFKPSGGLISELNFRSYKNVWGYFSVSSCGKFEIFIHTSSFINLYRKLNLTIKRISP